MARRRKGRAVNGVFLLDKPLGASSNQVLQKVRWLFQAQKAGHTGALDPLASGLLPICLGEATKFSQFLLDADKSYQVSAKLGVRTTTSDADGEVVEALPVSTTEAELHAVIEQFKGSSLQVPSMYSALKYQGKPLYHYARQGIEVPREPRPIHISRLDLCNFNGDEITLEVDCSKGTYIRSLVDDMGQALGCGAYVTGLHRTQAGNFNATQMFGLEQLEALADKAHQSGDFSALDALLLPMDSLLQGLPPVSLVQTQALPFGNGNPVAVTAEPGQVRVYAEDQRLLGAGEVDSAGMLHPKRLVVYS